MGRIKLNTKTKKAVKESYIDDLGYDIDTDLDSEIDVYDAINNNSDKFYGNTDYSDENGEVVEDEFEDEPFEQETEEQQDDSKDDYIGKDVTAAVVTALRDELKKKEYLRDYLRFRYRGEVCDGVPMAEINPSKFVFKIDDKLVGVKLGEIKIL